MLRLADVLQRGLVLQMRGARTHKRIRYELD